MTGGLLLVILLARPAAAAAGGVPPRELVESARGGDAEAMDRLGVWHDDRGDGVEALKWYRMSADRGFAPALHHVGVMLEGGREGKGVARDCPGARRALLAAAAKGVEAAVFRLGYQYYRGVCAARDYGRAWELFDRSGTPMGMYYMARIADGGQGRARDGAEAARQYERAYQAGMTALANNLAHLYEGGAPGLPRDPEKAYLWALRGRDQADARDRARLERLGRDLPADARARAEAASRQPR